VSSKPNSIDDAALGALIDRKVREAGNLNGSRLEKEREEVLRYYNRELPKPISPGSSSYVSSDVYDAVNSIKAQLVETFATGREIIRFTPQNAKDVEAARIASEYANYILFRKNNGYSIIQDVIDDALKARVGIVKVFWDEKKESREEAFGPIDPISLEAIVGSPDIETLEAEVDTETGLAHGKLTRVIDKSEVRIETVAPEHFGVEPWATNLDAFHFCKTMKTKGQLAEMGFDVSKLKDVAPDADNVDQDTLETQARFSQIDTGYTPNQTEDRDIDRKYWVFECYVPMSDEEDRPKLYRVIRVGSVNLAFDEVDRSPFKIYVPLPIPHSFYGDSFARLVIPYQRARTALTRGILDHTAITTNPRYLVAKGGLANPREMLENRLGGIINVNDANSVAPLPQASLNPFVFQTLSTLQDSREATTGVSSLSQGLDKDALSKQNSGAMVNQLIDLSMTRQKVMARNLAYNFLVPLFIEIYRLVIENDANIQQNEIEIAGNWVQVDPRTWIDRKDAEPDMHLAQNDAQNEAQKFATLLTMAGQDPELNTMLGMKGKYNAASQVLKLNGIKNVNDFLTPPEQIPPPPPPQPDPMAVAQLQLQSRQVAVQEMAAQIELMKVQADAKDKEHRAQIAEMQAKLQAALKAKDSHRKDMDLTNRIDIDQREMAITEHAAQTTPTDVRAILSTPKP
jgi:hypothetical protein